MDISEHIGSTTTQEEIEPFLEVTRVSAEAAQPGPYYLGSFYS